MDSSHRTSGPKPIAPALRFWPKVEKSEGCWLWTASLDGHGYGQFGVAAGKLVRAHRFAYEQVVGPIPAGMHLDHLCRNRACVNPAHLEPVTNRENLLRGDTVVAANAVKTHCNAGHALTGANLYIERPNKRRCRECRRLAEQRRRDKLKAVDV